MRRLVSAFLLFSAVAAPLAAQQRPLPPLKDVHPVGDTSVFATFRFPAANDIREGSGMPGPRYWENHADYDISASLDTAAKTLHGRLTLRYTNNSPDTLRFIWMQTEQNAFRDNSLNSYIFPPDSRFGARNFEGGDVIERIEQVTGGGRVASHRTPLDTLVNGTVMKVDLAEPLAPGHVATIEIAWHFLIPEHGADRMGRDGALYEIAQWYPRMCVYDDVRGWNTEPYLGQGEFYLEYGDFNVAVTVPAGYIVAGTGMLQNPAEVLTAAEIHRLAEAAHSDTTIHIVSAEELKSGTARPRSSGTLTWHFAAKHVRDAVWAGSPDYEWDASSYKGAIANAYFRPASAFNWDDAADQARMSIMEYSERWFPYPYPQISVVEGPISGMEYPMLAMETVSQSKPDLYSVITHEVGHNWFPMIVGSNEREYMWMDEGFNTFINTFSEARRYPQNGDQIQRADNDMRQIELVMRLGLDVPIMMNPDRIDPNLLGITAYEKPSVGLQLLREQILGPRAFDDAFRRYISRWAFKHPTPTDFFRTMEDAAGRRLDWFWREWFFETDRFDQAIDTVATRQAGDTQHVAVMYGNRMRGVLPILARFTFADGSTTDFDYPAEVWSTNTSHYIRRYAFAGKTLAKIELDPDQHIVDVERSNNTWTAK
ncbi:MAG: M1 family metallopeptidase [Gemmatimonadales bacterium]